MRIVGRLASAKEVIMQTCVIIAAVAVDALLEELMAQRPEVRITYPPSRSSGGGNKDSGPEPLQGAGPLPTKENEMRKLLLRRGLSRAP
jgi:hypothetical protein